MRFAIDSGTITGVTGNSHIGLDSKSYGRLIFGRQDLHWFNTESELGIPGALAADSASILSFAGGGNKAIANATRTPNVVHYRTPN